MVDDAPSRVEASWWQRLFRVQPKQNAFVELYEKIVNGGAQSLTDEAVEEVRHRFHLSPKDERIGLEDLYAVCVRRAISDRILTDQESSELEHLRGVFRLSPSTARKILGDIAEGVYAREFKSAIADETLTSAERSALESLASSLKLSEEEVARIRKDAATPLMKRLVDRSIQDRRLSPDEESHLRAVAADLGVQLNVDAETTLTLHRYRLLWQIEHGELPELTVPVHLQRGEICHGVLRSTLFEPRTVTRSVAYHGPRLRVRIAKGLYWNAGQVFFSPQRREEWKELDLGTLYITSKRLVFDGSTKSRSLLWRRVLDWEVFQDGVKIEKDSGRDQLFKAISGDMEVIGAIIAAARERAAR